jgi:3-hydroxyacyl-CoA dehydrogenase
VLSQTLRYAAALVPDIADDICAVNTAMKLGYNWKYGPFELIDQLGADALAQRLEADGLSVPPLLEMARAYGFYRHEPGETRYLQPDGSYRPLQRPPGILLLADLKRHADPLLSNDAASLWDIGDGVTCLEFHSKMNSIDAQTLEMLSDSLDWVAANGKAMVIYNEGENFSAGANLGLLVFAASLGGWDEIAAIVRQGQEIGRAHV